MKFFTHPVGGNVPSPAMMNRRAGDLLIRLGDRSVTGVRKNYSLLP
jgi:hypothetical protein